MSIELSIEQLAMRSAVENYEIYWRNCIPNNELRRREGLPETTEEYLKDRKREISLKDLKVSAELREPVEAKSAIDPRVTTVLEKYIKDPVTRQQAALEITQLKP